MVVCEILHCQCILLEECFIGLIWTTVSMTQLFGWHRLLNSLNIPLSVETVCVFTAPIFSVNASWATYLLTKVVFLLLKTHALTLDYWSSLVISLLCLQETKGPGAGLMAATILAMVIVILTMYFVWKILDPWYVCLVYIFSALLFFCGRIKNEAIR